MVAPSPWATNTGSTPTDRHARTGELTPPGMTCLARSKIAWLREIDIARRVAQCHHRGVRIALVIATLFVAAPPAHSCPAPTAPYWPGPVAVAFAAAGG